MLRHWLLSDNSWGGRGFTEIGYYLTTAGKMLRHLLLPDNSRRCFTTLTITWQQYGRFYDIDYYLTIVWKILQHWLLPDNGREEFYGHCLYRTPRCWDANVCNQRKDVGKTILLFKIWITTTRSRVSPRNNKEEIRYQKSSRLSIWSCCVDIITSFSRQDELGIPG